MPESRFTDEQLVDKALHALIQHARLHEQGEMTERERALVRFALAFLYRGGNREPYERFWRESCRPKGVIEADEFGRFQSIRGAMARILRAHGRDYW